jgi:hypothetical protein
MDEPVGEFERVAGAHRESGLIAELWAFACHTKKWWLLPIVVVLLLLGLLLLTSGSVAAPFIYTLF